jgi:cell division septum initiation protein DivIVA
MAARLDDGSRVEFASERDFSRFLFSHWGIQDPVLTNIRNEKAQLYSSQLLPLFYLDQGHGYNTEYYAVQKFIKDQYAEAMRLIFGLAPKNLYDKKRARIELKEREDYLDRTLARSEKLIEELTRDLGGPRRSLADLNNELQIAMDGLDELRRSGASAERINLELDSRLGQLQQEERELLRERITLNGRVRSFTQIRQEIEIETNTLSLNEEARRVFSSFDAICSNEGCGLFVRSSENYGKSLLYLKDQVKDLNRVSKSLEDTIAGVSARLNTLGLEIASLRSQRLTEASEPGAASIVGAAEQLTEKVIGLKKAIQIESELFRQESDYVTRLSERSQVQSNLAGLDSNQSTSSVELLSLRNALKERIVHWLNILRTQNVNRDVDVGPDFDVAFGGEKSTSIDSSSTQTRVVLAMRTASFELAIQRNRALPRFFILDTPRQQDISRDDLAEYMRHVHEMAATLEAQIIYSTTNQRYDLEAGDVEWEPKYPGDEQPMYLGTKT